TASKFAFILLFSALSLGVVFKALTLWGFDVYKVFAQINPAMLLISLASILAFMVIPLASFRGKVRMTALIIGAFLFIEGLQISTWLLHPTYTLTAANHLLAGMMKERETVVTRYETVFLSSNARVICYWPREGFNVDAFVKFHPAYILILRRDDWVDFSL